jgi:hypothetical protein
MVCEQLDEPYLWVDRFCILQDDPKDKTHQIGAMDRIFSAARYDLIAKHGTGVDFGFPGVGHARKVSQSQAGLPDMTMTNIVGDRCTDDTEVWETRGWTYQEGVFPRGRLYFANHRAYFECDTLSHMRTCTIQTSIQDTHEYPDSCFQMTARVLTLMSGMCTTMPCDSSRIEATYTRHSQASPLRFSVPHQRIMDCPSRILIAHCAGTNALTQPFLSRQKKEAFTFLPGHGSPKSPLPAPFNTTFPKRTTAGH